MTRLMAALALTAALGCASCGPSPETIATAKPAAGKDLASFSENIAKKASLGSQASLIQYFCTNTTGQRCPPDILDRLKSYGVDGDASGVDIAYAFTVMAADVHDGTPDKASSDVDFLSAAYRVVLAREPDAGGAKTNLAFIKDSGQRKTLLRSLLQSAEFKAR